MISLDQTKDILLVEDRQSQLDLIEEALLEISMHYQLHRVKNGEEALDFLYQKKNYLQAPRPNLILLDLNLPRMDGREFLVTIKADPNLRAIPVVVFTTSAASTDILSSYVLHANCYITKPSDLDQFFTVVRRIVMFWLSVVTLPSTATLDVKRPSMVNRSLSSAWMD